MCSVRGWAGKRNRESQDSGPMLCYVMAHFDSLSPKYAYSHTPEEVISWFKDCNLENIRTHSWRTAVSGIRATKDKE